MTKLKLNLKFLFELELFSKIDLNIIEIQIEEKSVTKM